MREGKQRNIRCFQHIHSRLTECSHRRSGRRQRATNTLLLKVVHKDLNSRNNLVVDESNKPLKVWQQNLADGFRNLTEAQLQFGQLTGECISSSSRSTLESCTQLKSRSVEVFSLHRVLIKRNTQLGQCCERTICGTTDGRRNSLKVFTRPRTHIKADLQQPLCFAQIARTTNQNCQRWTQLLLRHSSTHLQRADKVHR